MKKPFDKKSTSGLAKKPEKPQITTPPAGTPPPAKQDRSPHPKHKGQKAAAGNMPVMSVQRVPSVCSEAGLCMGAYGADSVFSPEHN